MVSAVFRSTIAANLTPDDMRGRVSGVEFAVYAGGPVLGDVESGVVGGLAGLPFAIVSGGVACVIAAGLFAARVRGLATYRTTPKASARRLDTPPRLDPVRSREPDPPDSNSGPGGSKLCGGRRPSAGGPPGRCQSRLKSS